MSSHCQLTGAPQAHLALGNRLELDPEDPEPIQVGLPLVKTHLQAILSGQSMGEARGKELLGL